MNTTVRLASDMPPGPQNPIRSSSPHLRAVNAATMLLEDLKHGRTSSTVMRGLLQEFNKHAPVLEPDFEDLRFESLDSEHGRETLERFAYLPIQRERAM